MLAQSRKFLNIATGAGNSLLSMLLLSGLFERYLRSQRFLEAKQANLPCIASLASTWRAFSMEKEFRTLVNKERI